MGRWMRSLGRRTHQRSGEDRPMPPNRPMTADRGQQRSVLPDPRALARFGAHVAPRGEVCALGSPIRGAGRVG